MAYLGLAILCSASLALIFRHTEARNYSRYAVTLSNYGTAVVFAVVLWLGGGHGVPDRSAVLIGIPAGILFFAAFIAYQRAVRAYGAGPAGMYGKLGVLVPMMLSVVIWQEIPTALQAAGAVLALAAIMLSQTGNGAVVRPLLLGLLVAMGFAEFSNKVFEYYGDLSDRPAFLAIVFGTALLLAIVELTRRRTRPTPRELLWGVAVGVPNLLSSYFLIAALTTIPAATAFPSFSAGSTVVIVLGAVVLYRDTMSRRQWAALGMTVIALILVG